MAVPVRRPRSPSPSAVPAPAAVPLPSPFPLPSTRWGVPIRCLVYSLDRFSKMHLRPILSLAFGAALFACGGRTSLDVDLGGVPVEAGADVVIISDAGCTSASDCEDGIACTLDRCDPGLRVCTHTPRDPMCDDSVFCNGAERCDPTQGCKVSPPPNCAGTVSCTIDTCDEANKTCKHVPDNKLCPISHVCDLVLGCQAHAFAHDSTTLYDVRLPSGQVKTIGTTQSQLTDIALAPTNVLYGVGFGSLYIVDQQLGTATLSKPINGTTLNAADVAPNGKLYVAGGNALYTLDTGTGAIQFVTWFPGSTSSSGDLAFVGSRLLATASSGGGADALVEFDLINNTAKVLGSVGYKCVWGLAAYGPTLYGLTCEGRILSMDTSTGGGTQLNQISTAFWGAAAR